MKTLFSWLLVPILSIAVGFSSLPANTVEIEAVALEEPVTVFLLRHAEADKSDPANRNPGLSEAGAERAQVLAKLLSSAGVTHMFSSEYQRTQSTLKPLAEILELDVREVSARSPDDQLAAIAALPAGSVAVIAGHSNTTPGLVEGFGVTLSGIEQHPQHGPMLGHDEYDRLFIVNLPRSEQAAASVIELRYGN